MFFSPDSLRKVGKLATSERRSPQIEISSRPHATNGLQTVRPLRSCDRGSSPEATSEDSGITSEFPELSSTLLSGDILWARGPLWLASHTRQLKQPRSNSVHDCH